MLGFNPPTTIDATLQKALQDLARDRARSLGPDLSVAIVAVDKETGEVLARVASADYFDASRAGQVDMTEALRSPGSTLKPFIYGLGFEDGAIHPETLIEDRPVRFGGYAPENFDLTFQGTVTVRKALQLLNVPAVAVLGQVGASRSPRPRRYAGAAGLPGLAMGLAVGSAPSRECSTTACAAGTTVPLLNAVGEYAAAALVGRCRDGTPATCCSARRRRASHLRRPAPAAIAAWSVLCRRPSWRKIDRWRRCGSGRPRRRHPPTPTPHRQASDTALRRASQPTPPPPRNARSNFRLGRRNCMFPGPGSPQAGAAVSR
jgi:hypothetical protein